MVEFAGQPPFGGGDPTQRLTAIEAELHRVQTELRQLHEALFQITYVAPARPREGMLRFADGTHWNPGSGVGYYQYKSGAWVAL